MNRVEEDLRQGKAFDSYITEAMLVCALRFDGYRYLEASIPRFRKKEAFRRS
jgi:hypothetical protein